MNQERLTWAWRIAVLAVLGWIGAELHMLRGESNNGIGYHAEESLDNIENNTRETRDAVNNLLRYR